MNMIAAHISMEMATHGFTDISVREVLQPAWTTDWIPESARQKLREYGIAPPEQAAARAAPVFRGFGRLPPSVVEKYPKNSLNMGLHRLQGAVYAARTVWEPFDYFKCH
jgi:ring-1,2-phenylacetyl-CoA epoxidase subunit PaaD